MKKKRTWREKLTDSKDFSRVCAADPKKGGRWAGTFVIPAPLEVDGLMKRVRRGRLTTIDSMRDCLAKRHGVSFACPITTGIFAWIAAHAADEAEREGKRRVTPYWRTLKTGGELNLKYPGGVANLRKRLEGEGHEIVKKGKRFFVLDYQGRMAQM
jgi:hypothetical protein